MADARVLTVKQPWADLIVAGVKDVENRTRPFPTTLLRCPRCDNRQGSWREAIRFDGGDVPPGLGHVPCPWCDDTGPAGDYDGWPIRVWIHAAKTVDYSEAARAAVVALGRHRYGDQPYAAEVIALYHRIKSRAGKVLGSVEVTGCHHADECRHYVLNGPGQFTWQHCSRWANPDVSHWTLANPVPLAEPAPAKGMLGLWRPDAQLVAQLEEVSRG